MFNGGFPSAPCRFFFFRRVFAAMSVAVEVAGGGGGHVIYLSPFLLLEHVLHLSPPTSVHCYSWWRHLGNSHSPFLLCCSLCPSRFSAVRPRTLSCFSVSPFASLSRLQLPNVEQRLTFSLVPSFLLGLLFVSLIFRLHSLRLVPSDRLTAPLAPPATAKNRFPLRLKLRAWNSWQLFGTTRDPLFSVLARVSPSLFPPFLRSSFPASTSTSER